MKIIFLAIFTLSLNAFAKKPVVEISVTEIPRVTFQLAEGSKKKPHKLTRLAKGRSMTKTLSHAEFGRIYDQLVDTYWTAKPPRRGRPCTSAVKIKIGHKTTKVCSENRKASRQAAQLVLKLSDSF